MCGVLGGTFPQRIFISKGKNWKPGLKAGKHKQSLLFYANAVRLMLGIAVYL